MPRVTISDMQKGIRASPAFESHWKSAAYMENIDINEIGRPVLRPGYVLAEDVEPDLEIIGQPSGIYTRSTPDRTAEAPDRTVATPDRIAETPDRTVATPDRTVEAPEPAEIIRTTVVGKRRRVVRITAQQVWDRYANSVWRRANVYIPFKNTLVELQKENIRPLVNPQTVRIIFLLDTDLLRQFAERIPDEFFDLLEENATIQAVFRDPDVLSVIADKDETAKLLELVGESTALLTDTDEVEAVLPLIPEPEPPASAKDVFERYREVWTAEPLFSELPNILRLIQIDRVRPLVNPQTIEILIEAPEILSQFFADEVADAFVNELTNNQDVKNVFGDKDVQQVWSDRDRTAEFLAHIEAAAPAAPAAPAQPVVPVPTTPPVDPTPTQPVDPTPTAPATPSTSVVHSGSSARDQIFKIHFLGDTIDGVTRKPFSRFYRINAGESWAYDAGRLFIAATGSANRWIDVANDAVEDGFRPAQYAWESENAAPSYAPSVDTNIPRGENSNVPAAINARKGALQDAVDATQTDPESLSYLDRIQLIRMNPATFSADNPGSLTFTVSAPLGVVIEITGNSGFRAAVPRKYNLINNEQIIGRRENFAPTVYPPGTHTVSWEAIEEIQRWRNHSQVSFRYVDENGKLRELGVREWPNTNVGVRFRGRTAAVVPETEPAHRNRYAICYTYVSTQFGLETEPSPAREFQLELDSSDTGDAEIGETNILVPFRLNLLDQPAWSDQVNIYVTEEPFGTFTYKGPELISTRGGSYIRTERVRLEDSEEYETVNVFSGFTSTGDPLPWEVETFQDEEIDFVLVRTIGTTREARDDEDHYWTTQGFRSSTTLGRDGHDLRLSLIYDAIGGEVTKEDADGNPLEAEGVTHFDSRLHPLSYTSTLTPTFAEDPPRNLDHILIYANRMWGYDSDSNSIRFSLISPSGAPNYDVRPYLKTDLPHSINLRGSWQSRVTHMEPIPGEGGIYVFFRDAIRTIAGRSLIKGMYSPDVSPETDLDASGGLNDFGTLSPRSVVPFRNMIIFLGSDKTLYQLTGNRRLRVQDFGLSIQPYLDQIPTEQLADVVSFGYNDKYHLILDDKVFVLDIKRRYWTSYDWDLRDAFWSKGGVDNESVLYGLDANNNLLRLYESALDDEDPIPWHWESNNLPMNDEYTTLTGIYVVHSSNAEDFADGVLPDVSVRVDTEGKRGTERIFKPSEFNRYRLGYHARGNQFKVVVSGVGVLPSISKVDIEFS